MEAEKAKTPEDRAFVDLVLQRSEELRQAKAYDEGIRVLSEALAREVDHAAIYFRLGNLYIDKGDLGRAERAYRRVLELDPEHDRAKNNLAVVYKRQGKYYEFVKTYKDAQRMALRPPGKKARRPGVSGWLQDHGSTMVVGLVIVGVIALILLFVRGS
ncbi:MAG: tetratricopeptide repeat protein [Candidatus Bipolaricaulota bacterium]|nr:tetratricopeptide repeat protein [Candidatus Bipolaricaulota bacterium]